MIERPEPKLGPKPSKQDQSNLKGFKRTAAAQLRRHEKRAATVPAWHDYWRDCFRVWASQYTRSSKEQLSKGTVPPTI